MTHDPLGGAGAARPDAPSVAFETWVAARGSALLRFAYLATGDRAEAEAAVHRALVAAYPRWRRLRTVDAQEAYLRQSVVRGLVSASRRRFRRGDRRRSGVSAGGSIWDRCTRLSVAQRSALVLRYYEEQSMAQTASVLGVTEAAAVGHVQRALAIVGADADAEAEQPREPTAPSERTGRAVRSTFIATSDELAGRNTDTATVRADARSRRMRTVGVTIAVALVLTGLTGLSLLDGQPAPAHHQRLTTPSQRQAPATLSWRRELYRNVQLRVPPGWGYADEPGATGCAEPPGGLPRTPYVARTEGAVTVATGCAVGQPGNRPDTRGWVDHVALSPRPSGARASLRRVGPFVVRTTLAGDAEVKIVSTNPALARRIARTTRVVGTSPTPCPTASPVQGPGFPRPVPAFDVTSIGSVTSIMVCQYARGPAPPTPGLVASYRLRGDAAMLELRALKAAPVGGGPDASRSCGSDLGLSAIVLSLETGRSAHRLFVYYSGCRGNGIDDGTTLRTITTAACKPLFVQPVALHLGWPADLRCLGG